MISTKIIILQKFMLISQGYLFDEHLKIACSHRRTKSSLTLHCTTVHACDVFSARYFTAQMLNWALTLTDSRFQLKESTKRSEITSSSNQDLVSFIHSLTPFISLLHHQIYLTLPIRSPKPLQTNAIHLAPFQRTLRTSAWGIKGSLG
jgi:hypothetical protein